MDLGDATVGGSPPPLRSTKGHQALVLARVAGTQDEQLEHTENLTGDFRIDNGIAKVDVGGQNAVFVDVGTTIESDLAPGPQVASTVDLLHLDDSITSVETPGADAYAAMIDQFADVVQHGARSLWGPDESRLLARWIEALLAAAAR